MKNLTVAALLAMSSILLSCKTPASNPPKRADLIDCNYYWQVRTRHVCIKDMPRAECEGLFGSSMFQREDTCVCDKPGKQKKQVEGSGYTQYDCN